jgi:hypothetical protein
LYFLVFLLVKCLAFFITRHSCLGFFFIGTISASISVIFCFTYSKRLGALIFNAKFFCCNNSPPALSFSRAICCVLIFLSIFISNHFYSFNSRITTTGLRPYILSQFSSNSITFFYCFKNLNISLCGLRWLATCTKYSWKLMVFIVKFILSICLNWAKLW